MRGKIAAFIAGALFTALVGPAFAGAGREDVRHERWRIRAQRKVADLRRDGYGPGDAPAILDVLIADFLQEGHGPLLNPAPGAPASAGTVTPGVNVGNGTLTVLGVRSASAMTETWTVLRSGQNARGAGLWAVSGSVSGAQDRKAVTGESYATDERQVAFVVQEGGVAFVDTDSFTFDTTAATGGVEAAEAVQAFGRSLGRAAVR